MFRKWILHKPNRIPLRISIYYASWYKIIKLIFCSWRTVQQLTIFNLHSCIKLNNATVTIRLRKKVLLFCLPDLYLHNVARRSYLGPCNHVINDLKTSKCWSWYLQSHELSESNTGSLHLAIEKQRTTVLIKCTQLFHLNLPKLVKARKVNVLQVPLRYF